MRVGLALPQFDFSVPGERPLRWETVVAWARRAEARGFDSVWLADHLFFEISPWGGPPGRFGAFDPLVALAALARVTHTVRLGTLVLCVPLRPATVLAKALATLDVAAGGRLVVGLGAGSYKEGIAAAGIPFESHERRLARLAEACDVLRGMFGGGPFSFAGDHERAVDARSLPRPVQRPGPPLWVGGRGDRLLDVVAGHADGWNTVWSWTPEAYRRRLAVLDQACERVGRDPATVTRSLGLYALVGEDRRDLARRYRRLVELSPSGVLDGRSLDDWREGHLVGTIDEVRDQLEQWAALGIETLMLGTGGVPFAVTTADDVEILAAACSLGPPCLDSEPPN